MPATAAAAAAAAEGARAIRSCARAASVCGRVHVRAHGPIGTAAQPSSLSACCLTAGPNSAVSCSIRHGSASGLDGPFGRCAALQRATRGGERRDECMLLLSMWRSGRMIHPPGHFLYIR